MKNTATMSALNLFLVFMFMTAGCKSYRNVEKLKPFMERDQEGNYVAEKEFSKIKKEEKILVELVDGKNFYLRYVSFSEKILRGKVWKDDITMSEIEPYNIIIPLEEIKNVRVWRPNAALTIGIPLGIFGVTFLIALIVVATEGINLVL
jgi:hypothetical protein